MNCLHNHGITHSPTSLSICRRTSHSSRLGDGADGAATQRGALAAQRLPGGATTPIKVRFSGGATTPQHRYSPTSQGTQHNDTRGRWVGGAYAPQRRAAPQPPPPLGAAAAGNSIADWEGVSCAWRVAHHVPAVIRGNRHEQRFLHARQASWWAKTWGAGRLSGD
jgi:hypothetical protein